MKSDLTTKIVRKIYKSEYTATHQSNSVCDWSHPRVRRYSVKIIRDGLSIPPCEMRFCSKTSFIAFAAVRNISSTGNDPPGSGNLCLKEMRTAWKVATVWSSVAESRGDARRMLSVSIGWVLKVTRSTKALFLKFWPRMPWRMKPWTFLKSNNCGCIMGRGSLWVCCWFSRYHAFDGYVFTLNLTVFADLRIKLDVWKTGEQIWVSFMLLLYKR